MKTIKCNYCGKLFRWDNICDHNNICDDCWESAEDERQIEIELK